MRDLDKILPAEANELTIDEVFILCDFGSITPKSGKAILFSVIPR